MWHDVLSLYGAAMLLARLSRFRALRSLSVLASATTYLSATLLLACGAQHGTPDVPSTPRPIPAPPAAASALPNASVAAGSAAIAAALRGAHRSPGAAERDQYRHPVETLAFFGLTPMMTVLDVGPGAGYYTELLAPALAKDGVYLATNNQPPTSAPEPSTSGWGASAGVRFDEMLAASPTLYGKVRVVRVDYAAPKLDLDATVDMVLAMREVHMMKNWGTLGIWLGEIHRALKPNGVFGIEDHRAAPGTDPEDCGKTGYLPEAWVIAQVEAAGFKLVAMSALNANPKDTKNYPNGVWSLPPSFYTGPLLSPHPADPADRAKYAAIGESDRMTLKFVKLGP